MLDDGALGDGGMLSSSGLSLDAVTPGENVLESFVLKSVGVYVNHTGVIGNTRLNEIGVRNRGGVDVGMVHGLLNDFSSVNLFESGNLLAVLIKMNLDHLPSEVDLDTTVPALVEDDLIGIGELEDEIVGSPVLNFSVRGGSSQSNVLSQVGFVVKSVEVRSLTLVGSLRRVADHLTMSVIPARLIVGLNSGLIEFVDEEVLFLG